MPRPPARDEVVPNSARLVTPEPYTVVTLRCGGCQHEQEARSSAKTSRCKGCGRVCRLGPPASPDVVPFRRAS